MKMNTNNLTFEASENYPLNLVYELTEITAVPSDLLPSVEYALNLFLTKREIKIIYMRYKYEMAYDVIGKEFGVTRERIRQIEKRAITKLKYPASLKWITLGVSGIIAKAKENAVEKELNAAAKNIEQISNYFKEITQNKSFTKQADDDKNQVYNLDAPIDILDLSVRSFNCLYRANIRTLRDLTNMSTDQLMNIRNLGKKSMLEVEELVHSKGLIFKDELTVEG